MYSANVGFGKMPFPASLPPPELPSEQAKWGRLVQECPVSTPSVGNRKKEGVLMNSFSTHPLPNF